MLPNIQKEHQHFCFALHRTDKLMWIEHFLRKIVRFLLLLTFLLVYQTVMVHMELSLITHYILHRQAACRRGYVAQNKKYVK